MNFDINAACLAAEGSRISRLPADNNAPAYISKNKLTTAEKFKERHLNDMRMRDDINFANYVRKDNNLLDLSTPIYNGNRRAENKNSHKMRSPQKQMPQIFANSAKNFMETRTTRDADVVVFDDIDVNWKSELNKRNVKVEKLRQKPQQQQGYNQYDEQYSQQCKIYQPQQEHQKGGINCNLMYHDNSQDNTGSTFKVTKMIGQLPIAEYEGSPRRIGNQKFEQNKILPKRAPGFPKRVSPSFATINQQQEQSPDNSLASQFKKLPFVKLVDINDDNNNNNNNSNNNININNDNQHDVDENEEDYCSGAVGGELIKTLTAAATNNLYELSETRKVLEDFFKENRQTHKNISDFNESNMAMQRAYENYRALECEAQDAEEEKAKEDYIGQRLARLPQEDFYLYQNSPRKQPSSEFTCSEKYYGGLFIDTMSRSSGDFADTELEANLQHYPRNFTLSPTETTDYDSNCGDLDSSSNEINYVNECALKTSKINMLEDGLSSGHASDIEANVMDCTPSSNQDITKHNQQEMPDSKKYRVVNIMDAHSISDLVLEIDADNGKAAYQEKHNDEHHVACKPTTTEFSSKTKHRYENNSKISSKAASSVEMHRRWQSSTPTPCESIEIQEAMNEIRSALQRAKKQPDKLKLCDEVLPVSPDSPVWVPRKSPNKMQNNNNEVPDSNHSSKDNSTLEIINKLTSAIKERGDEEEGDTDLETDRLLGQLRVQDDEQIFFNDKTIWSKISRAGSTDVSPTTSDLTLHTNTHSLSYKKPLKLSSATIRQGEGTLLTPTSPSKASHNKYDKDVDEDDDDDHDIDDDHDDVDDDVNDVTAMTSPEKLQYSKSPTGSLKSIKDTVNNGRRKARNKEGLLDPLVLIEGVLFRARYLGSTQLVCEGQPTKTTRMSQAEEAVSRIKAPEGESQPSTEVDLFISTEKIMVLNTDLKEIMMDHALRTISYIADIGDLVVLMARRRFMPAESSCGENDHGGYQQQQQQTSNNDKKKEMGSSSADSTNINSSKHNNRTPKMICHVFESDEAQFIAQSIGQAFQVAYMEFLKANGIEDHSFVKEMDYQEVLNSQEIFGDELQIFAKKELQKEVVVPKIKGEILGVVVVESGWGSMLPTVVIANLMSTGAAARCGQLNIGDQLIAINGLSLVGLPLSTCQNYIRNAKYQTAVKFTVVPCPPVVEVKIKRPNTKYQLGFSVQNGVICSLLRGGIAERGGVRVGHRIIEINNQSVVAVPHEKIVNLLATSVGEILMKTMPTSMFRLLTGQETPIFI